LSSIPAPRALLLLVVALAVAGCEPAPGSRGSAGASPAPSQAVAPADFVEATPQMRNPGASLTGTGWKPLDPAVSYLLGPHFSVALAATATAGELAAQDLDDSGLPLTGVQPEQGLRAAPGHEFLLVRGGKGAYATYPEGSYAHYTLVVDGHAQPFDGRFGGENSLLMASVPAGSPVRLEIADADRTQSIDLRTGAVGTVVASEHPQRVASVEDLADIYVAGAPNKPVDQQIAFYSLDVKMRLMGWETSHGWAPEGQAWLVVTVKSSMLLDGEIKLDLGKSLLLRTGAGKAVPLSGVLDIRISISDDGASSTQAVAVPATTTSVSVTLTTHGTPLTSSGQRADTVRMSSSHTHATLTLAPETAR
jgi:hypothetical protein